MHAMPSGKRPKVLFRADDFDALIEPLGCLTNEAKAAELGVDPGNLSRIYRGQPVSAEFIARVRIRFPLVPYERLFREEMS